MGGLAPRRSDEESGDYVDARLADYFEYLWEDGEGLSVANYTLAAVVHFIPAMGSKLPAARRTIKGWRKLELPARATPLTLDMALAVCGVFLLWKKPRLGYLILVGFDLFLRSQEIMGMRLGMLSLAVDSSSCVVSFTDGTKTS